MLFPDTKVSEDELLRARNQLRSSLLMNLETRGILCEDIGRQVLAEDHRIDPAELCDRIEAVTADDLLRLSREVLSSPPAFAVVGDHSSVPEYDMFAKFFENQ